MLSVSDFSLLSKTEINRNNLIKDNKNHYFFERKKHLMFEYATTARERGIGVIIAGAGGAAHVAGVTAALTTVPVIGVPIKTSTLNGLDSLLSIVQMPGGIPVSTTAINGAKNAALIAASIFALTDKDLEARLEAYRKAQTEKVLSAEL